ncbi:MAG: 4-hydroxythreonine-4-phosphate dehydrogenase PdxA [Polyangiaceae bacterium]|nr:4-hydroxythreonine-4-phosphate dehydrogenase PdxA [Polyangiaceae bacterium]
MKRNVARLAVSVGCPSGVGPEVSVAASARIRPRDGARVLLVGDLGGLRVAARTVGVDPARLVEVTDASSAFDLSSRVIPVLQPGAALASKDRRPGKPSRVGGRAQLRFIDVATDLVAAGQADALVTGPVSKDAIARSGAPGARGFLGHTEHLATRLGAHEVTMAFWSKALTTSLVTTHLPLSLVPTAITKEGVARATFWTGWLVERLAYSAQLRQRGKRPVIAVAALNPHAGEHGLLGDEETRILAKGITLARRRLVLAKIDVAVEGPVPAESAFRLGAKGAFAAIVAMYHDQATIPMKLLGFGEAVNVSLGLPIVRTSVDHGTAYDRAGKGTADPRGMLEAMHLAARLARP